MMVGLGGAAAAAMGELARAEACAGGENSQDDLFDLPLTRPAAEAEQAKVKRGPGRPKGATNLAAREFRDYLRRRGVDPLEQMMRWIMLTPHAMAQELGMTAAEAFKEQRILWAELSPYLHSKVAPTDDQGNAVPVFSLSIGGAAPVGADGAALPPWEWRAQQNQRIIDDGRPESQPVESQQSGES